jgi:hypothetical protein
MEYGTSGNNNVAIGGSALANNSTGTENVAIGSALAKNTTGEGNIAIGPSGLGGNTTGTNNIGIGSNTLGFAPTGGNTGNNNIAIGWGAGLGSSPVNFGNNNIFIGPLAASAITLNGSTNNIHIGSPGAATDNATIRIGTLGTQVSFFVAGVSNTNISGAQVLIDSFNGQLGIMNSSRRYKEDIQDMANASNGLMRLRPVTFRYKKPFADGSKPIQYGLIAEEVADVYPDLVARSADGQIESVKYQVLDSMLLNEVQRQEKEIHGLKEENDLLRDRLARLEAAMEKMTTSVGHQ